jgi:hypothetical protein
LRLTISVEERKIEELVAARDFHILRSPVDGWVTQILHNAGEAVLAGDPIAIVTSEEPVRLVAYINESHAPRVSMNSEVSVIRRTSPVETVRSKVIHVGPAIELLPERLWRSPTLPSYGRPIVIAGIPGWRLLPGEVLGVRLGSVTNPFDRRTE